MVQPLDFTEGGLQTVPLRLVLLAAFGFGDGVFEDAGVGPELEFFEGVTAGEEVEDGSDDGLLMRIQRHARSGLDVGGLDVEVCEGIVREGWDEGTGG